MLVYPPPVFAQLSVGGSEREFILTILTVLHHVNDAHTAQHRHGNHRLRQRCAAVEGMKDTLRMARAISFARLAILHYTLATYIAVRRPRLHESPRRESEVRHHDLTTIQQACAESLARGGIFVEGAYGSARSYSGISDPLHRPTKAATW